MSHKKKTIRSETIMPYLILWCFGVFVITVVLFMVTRFQRLDNSVQLLIKQEESFSRFFNNYIEKRIGILKKLANEKHISTALNNSSRCDADDLSIVLNTVKKVTDIAIVYIMDTDGNVVGSSTYGEGLSLTGNNYSFREYFKTAMNGDVELYPALGITTHKRGLYLSSPVYDKNKIVGVVVVKIALKEIDALLVSKDRISFMVSEQGIIFATNKKEWLFHSIEPISKNTKDKIIATRQFNDKPLLMMPVKLNEDRIYIDGTLHRNFSFNLSISGWKIISCIDEGLYSLTRIQKILLMIAFIVSVMVLTLIVLLTKNIVVRIRIERQLRSSEENIRTTLNSVGEAVITTETHGIIIGMNPIAEKLCEWNFENATGKQLSDVFQIVDSITHIKCENPVDKVIAAEKVIGVASNAVLVSRSGKEYKISDSAAPVRNSRGVITGIVLVFRDITDEIKIQEQLRHHQKMDAIGQLAGGVAHDFNNMLAGIISAAELVVLSKNLDKDNMELLQIILAASKNATNLTKKLLTFSKKSIQNFIVINMNDVVKDSIALLEKSIDRKIDIVKNFRAKNSNVIGDSTQLENAILNIGINSGHAMKNGGTLKISTSNIILDNKYCDNNHFNIKPGKYLEIAISDSGIGIDKKHLNKIFDPFFTTKTQGKGTGLGLAAVYATIQEHKGAILVDSEVGVGTVFHIFLRLTHNKVLEVPKQEVVLVGSGTVLVVDDEELIRVTTTSILKKIGFKVLLAENGKNAVELYKQKSKDIDLVLMDIIMPEMNGQESFEAMKKYNPDCKVILTSGYVNNVNIKQLQKDGLCGFLQKPFNVPELIRLVNSVIK